MGGSARLFFVTIILFSLAVPLNFALSAPKQPSAQACVPPPQGIVNWWPGNYTAADIIGGNTGTWQGSVGADYTTGRVDGTFRTSRYSNLAFSNNFIFNNPGNATIEFWIYPYYAAPDQSVMYGRADTGYDIARFNIGMSDNNFWVDYRSDSNSFHQMGFFGPIANNQWQHIAIVREIDLQHHYYIYLNGDLKSAVTDISPDLPTLSGWHLAHPAAGLDGMAGGIDELTFYNRALSLSEIQAIYNSGSFGKCKSGELQINDVLVSSVLLGESSTDTFTAVGGTPPYTWSLLGGTIPQGMNLTSDGILTGTPTEAGNFTFTLQVTDAASATAFKSFSKVVYMTLPEANLLIGKRGVRPVPGRDSTYILFVQNLDNFNAENTYVEEYLDSEVFKFKESFTPGWNLENADGDDNNNYLVWNNLSFMPGEVKVFTYLTQILQTVPLGYDVIGGDACASDYAIAGKQKTKAVCSPFEGPDAQFLAQPLIHEGGSPLQVCTNSVGKTGLGGFLCRSSRAHKGVDLTAAPDTEVYIPEAGKCVFRGWQNETNHNQGFGYNIKIEHTSGPYKGCRTIYAHLKEIVLMPCPSNQILPAGTFIGVTGKTGNAADTACSHLHFQLQCPNTNGILKDKNPCGGLGNPDFCSCCPKCTADHQKAIASRDPNEKIVLQPLYVKSGSDLTYSIYFENIGNAAALDVFLNDTLVPSLNLTSITVMAKNGSFIPLADGIPVVLYESVKNITENVTILNITYFVNTTIYENWSVKLLGNFLRWELNGINLEPNVTDFVIFNMKSNQGLPSGTEIRNNATIQFEIFESLTTNSTLNIIDDISPSCIMNSLPPITTESPFSISWQSTDSTGVVATSTVFVSTNGFAYRELLQNETSNVTDSSLLFIGSPGTTYYFSCIATDIAGNSEVQVPAAETSTTVQNAKSVSFLTDWNLISLPMQVANSNKNFLFPASTSSAYAYNGAYITENSLVPGKGYWLKYPYYDNVLVFGIEILNLTINVTKGWNMIGALAVPIATANISSNPLEIVQSNYFAYNGAYELSPMLEPGKGYWVKVNQSGRLILTSGSSQQMQANFYDGLNSLSISQSSGISRQNLYFGNTPQLILPDKKLLPPKMSGSFDARYSSQNFAEIIPSSFTNPISYLIFLDVQSYPLLIGYNIKQNGFASKVSYVSGGKTIYQSLIGTGSFSITDSKVRNMTLTLSPTTAALSVTKSGNGAGTISGSGISCGTDCTENYIFGTSVTLSALTSAGSKFIGWSGSCSGTAVCTISMNQPKSVNAQFNLNTYTLSVTKSGTGGGTISGTGISCGTDCSETFNYGTIVTLSALPASGSSFAGWSGACSGTGKCTLTMNATKSVSAIFSAIGKLPVNELQ